MEVRGHSITQFFGQGAEKGVKVQSVDDAIEEAIIQESQNITSP